MDSGRPRDGGTPDSFVPDPCEGVVCMGFQHCVAGACVDFPPCSGDGTCLEGSVCHARRCVPVDVDVDGDGSPAGMDCDETNPSRSPLEPEICNMVDDDCDPNVDEGDPAELCAFYPGGGICLDGSCGCPAGTFDLDRTAPGCECVAAPPIGEGVTCATAIDLGDIPDNGMRMEVSGNVLPDDRDVWYRFRGVDSADTACDNFHVRVQFMMNPADTFELYVTRGACAAGGCPDAAYSDFSWATDFRTTIAGTLTGQCPCAPNGAVPPANVSVCEDDSANFFLRVRRRAGSVLSCAPYVIEISNGLYDTP